jgi:hypothetical protein
MAQGKTREMFGDDNAPVSTKEDKTPPKVVFQLSEKDAKDLLVSGGYTAIEADSIYQDPRIVRAMNNIFNAGATLKVEGFR